MPVQKTSAPGVRRANGAARKRRPTPRIWKPPFEPDSFTREELVAAIRKVMAQRQGGMPRRATT